MGVSTDAILAFGFDLGEELPLLNPEDSEDEEYSFDWWDWLDGELGLDGEDYGVRDAARKAYPLDLITHCSYDYPMYFLAINGSSIKARRGYPQSVQLPPIEADKIEAMRRFCDKHGIKWGEPKWHIFSLWG